MLFPGVDGGGAPGLVPGVGPMGGLAMPGLMGGPAGLEALGPGLGGMPGMPVGMAPCAR